jgi:hypothetical protein
MLCGSVLLTHTRLLSVSGRFGYICGYAMFPPVSAVLYPDPVCGKTPANQSRGVYFFLLSGLKAFLISSP